MERFFEKVETDIFRPLVGRHRAVAFEVLADLHDRQFGIGADYDLVLDRATLIDLVTTSVSAHRHLMVGDGDADELDEARDDADYAKKVVDRLLKFAIMSKTNDPVRLTVIFRFTPEGKRIARFCAESRRRTGIGRQRSIRSCKAALQTFLNTGEHVYLLDAYEFARTIYDDVCQVADLFLEFQAQIVARRYINSRDAVDEYLAQIEEFKRRAERYMTVDNVNTHAGEIVELTVQVECIDDDFARRVARSIAIDGPALIEQAEGIEVHLWIAGRIREVVVATRRTKHDELVRSVGDFSTRFMTLIQRMIRLQANSDDNPFLELAERFVSGPANAEEAADALLRRCLPPRPDLIDPTAIKLTVPQVRREPPRTLEAPEPTREERLAALVGMLVDQSYAVPEPEALAAIKRAVEENGYVDLVDLPVSTFHEFLVAISAVETVRGNPESKLKAESRNLRRDNDAFEATDYRITRT